MASRGTDFKKTINGRENYFTISEDAGGYTLGLHSPRGTYRTKIRQQDVAPVVDAVLAIEEKGLDSFLSCMNHNVDRVTALGVAQHLITSLKGDPSTKIEKEVMGTSTSVILARGMGIAEYCASQTASPTTFLSNGSSVDSPGFSQKPKI